MGMLVHRFLNRLVNVSLVCGICERLGSTVSKLQEVFTHCGFLAAKSVVNGNDVEDGESVGCGVEVHVV